jgi:hypothetical protein
VSTAEKKLKQQKRCVDLAVEDSYTYQYRIMKKILLCFVLMLTVCGCWAEDAPVLGVWEQLVVAERAVPSNSVRHNFIFSNKKLAHETTFSALSDSFSGSICCIKVSNPVSVDLNFLLKKYDWDNDDVDHLKHITGWKYIYEAHLVDSNLRNRNMQDLVRNMSHPNDVSPFSAAVISGWPVSAGSDGKRYRVDGSEFEFSSVYDEREDAMKYIFDFSGARSIFSEMPFPAE